MTDALPAKQVERHGQLTKADTVALWHAVQAQADLHRATRDLARDEGKFTPEQVAADQQRLLASKRALRKVNKLRKAGQ